ncbi:hypothetical protein ACKKBG_A01700 [Auxenochlorella protothecoides x Auxenochlorella symbiontica]
MDSSFVFQEQAPWRSSSGDEEEASPRLEEFEDDESELQDTLAHQVVSGARDAQGIPWSATPYTRADYRQVRQSQHRTYFNREVEVATAKSRLAMEAVKVSTSNTNMFMFHRNWRRLHSTIVHFQLRNLLWCPTTTDMYAVHENRVLTYSTATRVLRTVMDIGGGIAAPGAPGIGAAQVCTLCVKHGMAAAGGFGGELVVKRLESLETFTYSKRVTDNENGITNAIEIAPSPSGQVSVICSNNDNRVRCLDAETFQSVSTHVMPWAVNTTVAQPGGRLLCSVGDDPGALIFDPGVGPSRPAVKLADGHVDFSFAAAWHPGGNCVATGNQDCTTRVYDIRAPGKCLALLLSNVGAVRSLRFSDCGNFLAAAEPADFVTIFDVTTSYKRAQVIDLFGELAGVAFCPGSDCLNIAVADPHYSSVLQYNKMRMSYLYPLCE